MPESAYPFIQIIQIFRCKKMDGVSRNWPPKSCTARYELRRLNQLEEENRKLKWIVADLTLDKQMLQRRAQKKVGKPARRRRLSRTPDQPLCRFL